MDIQLKKLDEDNFDEFCRILSAMREWAEMGTLDDNSKSRLRSDYFIDNPKFESLLAFVDNKAVGFISFYETYATLEARVTMYIEDLFILDEYRHKGIGKVLVDGCLNIAKNRNNSRVDLLSFGEGPRKFYEKIGAKWKDHNYHYRITEDLIEKGLFD